MRNTNSSQGIVFLLPPAVAGLSSTIHRSTDPPIHPLKTEEEEEEEEKKRKKEKKSTSPAFLLNHPLPNSLPPYSLNLRASTTTTTTTSIQNSTTLQPQQSLLGGIRLGEFLGAKEEAGVTKGPIGTMR